MFDCCKTFHGFLKLSYYWKYLFTWKR